MTRASGRRRPHLALLALLLVCVNTGPAMASVGKLSPDLLGAVTGGLLTRVPVIIQTAGTPLATDLILVRLLGGQVGPVFQSIPAFSADLPVGVVTLLAGNLRVRRISLDRVVRGCWDYNVESVAADVAGAQ